MKIEMTGITKAFGQNKVLKGVNFDILPGEIHALMGENGAGKSTLMNILTGIIAQDEGLIKVDDQIVNYPNAMVAEQAGISFIHQEMNNYGEMTVLENMFINREITNRFGINDTQTMRKQAQLYLEKLGVAIKLDQPINTLSVGNQQLIEIAKSLMTDAQIIIMDEPTAALSEKEIQNLFKIVKELQKDNVSFVYISHRMEEIMMLCDRVTVMRDGISVSTNNIKEININKIVKDMVGRELTDFYPKRTPKFGDVFLEVRNFSSTGLFNNINFKVHAGEIMAFSGLMGAGRTEIIRSIFGIDSFDTGQIYLHNKHIINKTPADAISNGIGFITENRKDEGLILEDSISNNIDLPSLDGFTKRGILDTKIIDIFVDKLIKRLHIKAMSSQDTVSSLSGGNQQKVVVAKWIGAGSKVLILDEPTRGVDVGAKHDIYELMNELTDRGVAIIMISSDLPEVIGMSDTITVIYEGQVSGTLTTKETTQEEIMTLATGGASNESIKK